MSYTVSIFAGGGSSLERLAGDLSRLLSIELKRVADLDGTRYTYFASDFDISVLGEHEFVNDRDMNFEDYAYEINFRRRGSMTPEAAQTETLRFARSAFSKLKESRKYRLMLVEDTQKKLASFDPD
jgi:hypothetical protein